MSRKQVFELIEWNGVNKWIWPTDHTMSFSDTDILNEYTKPNLKHSLVFKIILSKFWNKTFWPVSGNLLSWVKII